MATRAVAAAAVCATLLLGCFGCSSGDDSPASTASTVAFPEVDLEITVPSELEDLTYAIGKSEEGQPALYFSSAQMASVGGPSCAAGAQAAVSPYPLGQIVISEETPEHVREEARENPDDTLGHFVKQVGGQYLYYLAPPEESCTSGRKAATMQHNLTVKLRSALGTLHPTQ
jgi:hypothetical protein